MMDMKRRVIPGLCLASEPSVDQCKCVSEAEGSLALGWVKGVGLREVSWERHPGFWWFSYVDRCGLGEETLTIHPPDILLYPGDALDFSVMSSVLWQQQLS